MSAANALNKQQYSLPGMNGRIVQWISFAFTTTGATVTIPVNLRRVEAVILTPFQAPASDEILYWADTLSTTDASLVVPSTGLITIGRTGASKTSGLVAGAWVIGW